VLESTGSIHLQDITQRQDTGVRCSKPFRIL
jgi:hypothetical protein